MSTHSIIIDTDPGVDDAMAILLALKSPEIEIAGITTIFGNSTVTATTRNALNLLYFAGRTDIPVAKGAHVPLFINPVENGEFVHGADAMGNIGWHHHLSPNLKTIDPRAAQFIVEQVMSNPGKITLVPIGPLTNIALAMQLEPQIIRNVKQVVMMGGSVLQPGNVSPLAEANIFNDPHAASLVFNADWDITMAGLDVTEKILMDQAYFDDLADGGGMFGKFIWQIVKFYQNFHHEWHGMRNGEVQTHDPSAIAFLINPALFSAEYWSIQVPIQGEAIGATIADRKGKFYKSRKVRCLMHADDRAILDLYKQRITQI